MDSSNILEVGDIVVAKMPFSDLRDNKARPALVVGISSWHEVVLAMITSRNYNDQMSVRIPRECFDYVPNVLHNEVRCASLHTTSKSVISKKIGRLKPNLLKDVQARMRKACEMG